MDATNLPDKTNATHAAPTLAIALALLACLSIAMLRSPTNDAAPLGSAPVTYRIAPNTADANELCLLPGVGLPTAQKIIDHRETLGPFIAAADLENVSGIGPKTRAAIEPWITLD